jgi:hypothetical protein
MSQQINLYQAKFRKPRKPMSALEASLGLLAIIVVMFAFGGYSWQKNEQLTREARAVEHEAAVKKLLVDKLIVEVNDRKKDNRLEAAALAAEDQVAATREVMQIINGDAMGFSGSYSDQLRALARQAVYGMWLTGFTLSANADENLIRGRTLDAELVPTYLRRLNGEKVLQGQHFDSLTISTPEPAPGAAPGAAPATGTRVGATPVSAAAPVVRFLEFSVSASQAVPAKAGGK